VAWWLERLGSAVQTLGGALVVPAGLALDVATAPWNDDEEYNGFLNTLKSRSVARVTQWQHNADVTTLGGYSAAMKFGEEELYQPGTAGLSAAFTMGSPASFDPQHPGLGDVPGMLAARYQHVRESQIRENQGGPGGISMGEAGATMVGQILQPGVRAAATSGQEAQLAGGMYDPRFSVFDQEQREAYYQHGAGRLASGTIDAITRWYADVPVLAGKAAGAARRAYVTRPITPKTNIDKMVDSGRVGRFIAEIDKRATPEQRMDWLLRNKSIAGPKGAEDGPALAWLLAHAESPNEIRNVIKTAALQDARAYEALRLENEKLAAAVDRITETKMPLLEAALGRAGNNPARQATIGQMQERLTAELATNQDALRVAQMREAVSGTLSFAPRVTTGQRISSGIGFDLIQPSRYNAPVRIIKTLGSMRPGVVDFQRAEGYKPLQRMMDRAGHAVGPAGRLTADEKGALQTKYAQAWASGSEAAMQGVVQQAERAVMRRVTEGLGLDPNLADELVQQGWMRRDEETLKLRERAFSGAPSNKPGRTYLDELEIDGVLTRYPIDVPQLANEVALLDVDALTRVLKRKRDLIKGEEGGLVNALRAQRAGKPVEMAARHLEEIASAFNRTWKPLALLRPAWMIRTQTDEQARIIATVGAISHLPLAAASLGSSVAAKAKRVTRIDSEAKSNLGVGEQTVRGHVMQDAFGTADQPADVYRSLASSKPALQRLAQDSGRIHNALRGNGDVVNLFPHQKGYAEAWQNAVIHQIGNSPIAQRILDGETDDQIVGWLTRTPEGRDLRKRIGIRGHNPQMWVGEIRQQVDHYLPTDELQELAAKKQVRYTDLQKAVTVREQRPIVHGASLEEAMGTSQVQRTVSGIVQNLYASIGSAPTDVLARHPYFVNVYRKKRDELVAAYDDGAAFTPQLQARLEWRAREHALRQVKQTLYELAEEPNMGHVLRFVAPFYQAWQEVLTRWLSITMDNPAVIAHAFQLWQAPNKATWGVGVEERDGQEYVTLAATKWMQDNVPGMEAFAKVGMPKKSFGPVSGEPWWLPGMGPLAQVPVAEVARGRPDLAQSLNFFLPYGAGKDALDLVSPAWLRRLRTLHAKEGDRVYANTLNRVVIDMETDRRLGKLNLTDEQMYKEARRRTDAFFSLRSVANFVLPYSPTFSSPYQFYIDKSREYREKYPDDWEDRWLADFGPDYFAFTESFSMSVNQVSPTLEGYKATEKHAGLLAEFPELGGFIVGDEDNGAFNDAVYQWQFRTKVGPGDFRTQRMGESPRDNIANIQRRQGWNEWRKANTLIKAELVSRGLRSVTQKGAEDLQALKVAVRDKLSEEFPLWAEDYNSFNPKKTDETVAKMEKIVAASGEDRAGWATLREYLDARRQIKELLAARDKAGGSASMQAQSNEDLRIVWETVVNSMVERDLAFEDIWHHYLERDMGRDYEMQQLQLAAAGG